MFSIYVIVHTYAYTNGQLRKNTHTPMHKIY